MNQSANGTGPMLRSQSTWAMSIAKQWKLNRIPETKKHGTLLKKGIQLLTNARPQLSKNELSLPEQPFDLHLLNLSALFRQGRKVYLDQGGVFNPALVTSARTLSSSILLDPVIDYSPIESEFIWCALDPVESRNPNRLLILRSYCSSLFHEQNHRILWKLLPSPPSSPPALRRYLNFAESLVITLDMALGDQLGPQLATLFYLTGVTYDPGSTVYREVSSKREYRNYLQAALHATYLNLEMYDPEDIPRAIEALFPLLGPLANRAAVRSGNLDPLFIGRTNPIWQKEHKKTVLKKLYRAEKPVLDLSKNPMDNHQQYLIAERFFDIFGL